MKSATYIGRGGGLAVALGTGAWLASAPWVAAADESDVWGVGATTLDTALVPLASAADPAADTGVNLAVSYDGVPLFQSGDATATSFAGQGDLAIAYGNGATANAGTVMLPSGLSLSGSNDYAFAYGAGSTANAGGGSYNFATASDGATAYSGFDQTSTGAEFAGNGDYASASGAGSLADAFGSGGSASVFGTDSIADAGSLTGGSDIADVFGNGSTAVAGDITGTGANDFAAALGNDLTAIATGNYQFVFEPSLFGDAATAATAAVVPVDDYGLSSLLADFGWLGL